MRDHARRAGWLFLTILFVVTGVGIGIYAFWQGTHPSNPAATTSPQNQCSFASVPAESLSRPQVFKPAGDVKTLSTTDLTTGSGRPVQTGDCVSVKYYGTLAKDGSLFDEDYTQPLAIKYQVGAGQVIAGWDEGLIGMRAGGVRRLVIPSELAYGAQSPSAKIPANSDLVFTVKLESIK